MSNIAKNIQLLLSDILSFHEELEKVFAMDKGIHDQTLLESAVHAPFQTFDGKDLYPNIYAKAARLCFGIAKDHPFRDGNKRTAVHAALVYLAVNSIKLNYQDIELETAIIDIAAGNMTSDELADWFYQHTDTPAVNH